MDLIERLEDWDKERKCLDHGETDMEMGRGVRQGSCISPIPFNLYGEWLTSEALEVVGAFGIRGRFVGNKQKYRSDQVPWKSFDE